jgi:hypothetical protein
MSLARKDNGTFRPPGNAHRSRVAWTKADGIGHPINTVNLRLNYLKITNRQIKAGKRKYMNYTPVILLRIVLICIDAPIPHAYDLDIAL